MTSSRWARLVLICFCGFLFFPPGAAVSADNKEFLQELEERRNVVLMRIEAIKGLRKKNQARLEKAQGALKLAQDLEDTAAIDVATRAVTNVKSSIGQLRLAMRKEQSELVRIDRVLDEKDRMEVTPLSERVLVRKVPNPIQMPLGSFLRYIRSDRAGLVMDALEWGQGNLDEAIRYLDDQIVKHRAGNINSKSAMSYLEGMRSSYIAAGAEYRRRTMGDGKPVSIEDQALMNAMLERSSPNSWPGPKNPDPASRLPNPLDWRVQRQKKLQSALAQTSNDRAAAIALLSRDQKGLVAAKSAEYFLKGSAAYWDYLETGGPK